MNYTMVFFILRKFIGMTAILMLLPLLVSVIYGEANFWAFLVPSLTLLLLSFATRKMKPKNTTIYAKEGYLIVALAWLIVSLIGALPYYLSNVGLSYLHSLFEAVSGFTTTGSSVLANVETMPYSLLFWRSFTNWIGGMGVLVFLLAILPQTNSRPVHVMRAEMTGHQVGKLVSKVKNTVIILYGIYILMTLVLIGLLLLGRMPLFDSIVTAFATAGTGGFAIKNLSIAFYRSPYIETIIGIFMILFGINFNLYFLAFTAHIKNALKSEELWWYLGIILVSTVAIACNIYSTYQNAVQSLRYGFFQVSSIITTTGFTTADYNLWPNFSKTILVLLMFVGGMAGSTAGGLKVSRLVILVKSMLREVRTLISPRSVKVIKLDGQGLNDRVVSDVNIYFFTLMVLLAFSVLLLSLDNLDLVTAFTAAVTSINNVGPGLNGVGPFKSLDGLSNLSLLVLIFDMLVGRLEIFPIIMLFSPSIWKKK